METVEEWLESNNITSTHKLEVFKRLFEFKNKNPTVNFKEWCYENDVIWHTTNDCELELLKNLRKLWEHIYEKS